MARRRKNEGLVEVLLDAPWQVSVILAFVSYVALRWLIPSYLSQSVLLASLGATSRNFAPFSAFILVPGLFSYIKQQSSSDINSRSERKSSAIVRNEPFLEGNLNTITRTIQLDSTIVESKPGTWSLALLKEMDWKRFELLCAEYFRCLGKRVETLDQGADGGIDARVYSDKTNLLEYAIQCKSWSSSVGVKHLRELFGVMTHEVAGKGIFITTSDFTDEAKKFAEANSKRMFLIDGEKFLSMILKLKDEQKAKLLSFATEGDYTTPSCASCGTKLVKRTSNNKSFWGCSNFPRCRTTMTYTN